MALDYSKLDEQTNLLVTTKTALKTVANNYGGGITNDTPFANYSGVFDSLLSAGGGGEAVPYDGKYLVRVIDYDGTILKEAYLNTGDTFTLPFAPTNDRLTFQTWSSPVDIVNNTVTVTDDNIFIGAIYETKSGATEIDIFVNENTGLDFTLQNCTGLSTVDWGDGTTSTGSSSGATHTYASAGEYTIKAYGITSTQSYIFGQDGGGNNNYSVKKCFFANTISNFGNYALSYIANIEIISFPNSLGGSINYQFQNCNFLKTIIIPPNITVLGGRFIYSMAAETVVLPKGITITNSEALGSLFALKNISLPNTITTMGNSFLQFAYSLYRVKVPNSVSTIGNSFCYGNSYLKSIIFGENIESIGSNFLYANGKNIGLIDFSKALQVPTLGGALTITNTACRILVPSALYAEWITATNWADIAQYIFAV